MEQQDHGEIQLRVVAQRVSEARVRVDEVTVGEIGPGLLLLVGAGEGDSDAEVRWMADKCAHLRIFDDGEGRFNLSLLETGGSARNTGRRDR